MPSFPREVAQRRRQQAEVLLRAGHSDLEIQRRTGVDRNTVARYRKHLGLPGYQTRADSPACRHGHPFPQNAAHLANGWLYCRECRRLHTEQRAQPDWATVERMVSGEPPERITPRERAAAVRRLEQQRLALDVIAHLARCTPRTVYRIRKQIKEGSSY